MRRGAAELRRAIAARRVSPVEVLEQSLAAIEADDDRLNAFLAVDAAGARAAARRAEDAVARGGDLGLLHGVPVGVKDVEATAGLTTTFGSGSFRGHVPRADSPAVAALRAAGAVVVGKTNTPPFALLGETCNDLGDDCRNPWDPARTSGGSSGGSASAVAAGMVPVATGTDYGGSIAAPAGLCGTAPAVGAPVVVAWSGGLGRYPVDREVLDIASHAAATSDSLGCRVTAEVPALPDPWEVFAPLSATDLRLQLRAAGVAAEGLPDETRAELAAVPELTPEDYVAAVRRLRDFRAAAAAFFSRIPVVATPTTAVPAFPVRRPPSRIDGRAVRPGRHGFMPFQVPWNLTGGPVVTVPAGRTGTGLPVGLQLAAAPHADELLLQLAARYEAARPWGPPPRI